MRRKMVVRVSVCLNIWVTALLMIIVLAVPGEAKTTLTILPWRLYRDDQKAVFGDGEFLFKEYKKLHPDIDFKVLDPLNFNLATPEGFAKFLLLLESGSDMVPDIVECYALPELIELGLVAPVPDDMARDARSFFFGPTLIPLTKGKVLYGIPGMCHLYSLCYNQRIFEEDGFVKVPETWAEFKELAIKATRFNPDGSVKRWGFSFFAGPMNSVAHAFLSFLWSNNGTYIDENGNPHLMDREAEQTVEFLYGMYVSKAMCLGSWGGDEIRDNKALMAIIAPGARTALRPAMKDDYKNLATTLIPHGQGSFASYLYEYGLFVTAKSKKHEEAWKFVRWLTMEKSSRGQTRMGELTITGGAFPTNPLDLEARGEFRTEPFWRGFVQGIKYARSELPYFRQLEMQDKLANAILKAVTGKVSVKQALEEAQKALVNILKKK